MDPNQVLTVLHQSDVSASFTADGHVTIQVGFAVIKLSAEQLAAIFNAAPLADSWRKFVGGTQ